MTTSTPPAATERLTALFRSWRDGDSAAKAELFAMLYDELHALARSRIARERSDSLAPTGLVHEVFLRLDAEALGSGDRHAFLRLAATAMRRILIDGARRRSARRRATDALHRAHADPASSAAVRRDEYLVRLDDALEHLERVDPDLLAVVELRFLMGLDVRECAATLGVSTATVKRDWRTARAFLQREIERG